MFYSPTAILVFAFCDCHTQISRFSAAAFYFPAFGYDGVGIGLSPGFFRLGGTPSFFGSSWERLALRWAELRAGSLHSLRFLSLSPHRARDGLVTTLMTMLKMYMSKAILS